jgi:hypothetical protein
VIDPPLEREHDQRRGREVRPDLALAGRPAGRGADRGGADRDRVARPDVRFLRRKQVDGELLLDHARGRGRSHRVGAQLLGLGVVQRPGRDRRAPFRSVRTDDDEHGRVGGRADGEWLAGRQTRGRVEQLRGREPVEQVGQQDREGDLQRQIAVVQVEGQHGDAAPAGLAGEQQGPAFGLDQRARPGRQLDRARLAHMQIGGVDVAQQWIVRHARDARV